MNRKIVVGYVGWVGEPGDPINVQGTDLWYLPVSLVPDDNGDDVKASIASKTLNRCQAHHHALSILMDSQTPREFYLEQKPNGKWKLVSYPGFDPSVGFTEPEIGGDGATPQPVAGGTAESEPPSHEDSAPPVSAKPQGSTLPPPVPTTSYGPRVGNVVTNVVRLVAGGAIAYTEAEMQTAARRLWDLHTYVERYGDSRGDGGHGNR